ncbi:MAG: malectin domain-containing carbohydrate-binding protein [Pseudomonadota bacterium]
MEEIAFNQIGSLSGLQNPTSLTFGADGRLYVTQQNGQIIAIPVTIEDGEFIEVLGPGGQSQRETLTLNNGLGVVSGIINHNDDGRAIEPGFSNNEVFFDAGGSNPFNARQVTGIVATDDGNGNPVFYVSSSDPRISTGNSDRADTHLDTNSGIVTRVTGTPDGNGGFVWDAVDIVRGLPRSEENHATNGMVLDDATNTLYLQVGGNTNNGAPSNFFTWATEYSLAGTVLAIDLGAIEQLPIQTDDDAGKPLGNAPGGTPTARQFVYDLPTLDDPNNVNAPEFVTQDLIDTFPAIFGGNAVGDVPTDSQLIEAGYRETFDGRDLNGPFGGNDGFNQAVLPSNAPISIFADGLRNAYDLVQTENGQFFTVDNGSNNGLGNFPVVDGDGFGTNDIPDGSGAGSGEPLFQITEGGNYGHGAPTRGNPEGAGLVLRDNDGNQYAENPNLPGFSFTVGATFTGSGSNITVTDTSEYRVTAVSDITSLLPQYLLTEGTLTSDSLIHPTKFAVGPGETLADLTPAEQEARLQESSISVPRSINDGDSLAILGGSTNGIDEYIGDAFNGEIFGALVVTQFVNNITILNVNDDGTAVTPFNSVDVNDVDGEGVDTDGIITIATPGGSPLDVIVGDKTTGNAIFDGIIIAATIGSDNIFAYAPSDIVLPGDPDTDDDGVLNDDDPFLRDASNGTAVTVSPLNPVILDFDDNSDNSLQGVEGIATGLTGVATNGLVDFDEFSQQPSQFLGTGTARPNQVNQLDNVKFQTAAGGGATVIEFVSTGDATGTANTGEYLFQTGVTIPTGAETFSVSWTIFNPLLDQGAGTMTSDGNQEVGGFIGTGDQSNFLKIAATDSSIEGPGFVIYLEDNDVEVSSQFLAAADLFAGQTATDQEIRVELLVDVTGATPIATATIDYDVADDGNNGDGTSTVISSPIDLGTTNVADVIAGNFQVGGAESGLALGLWSTNGDVADADAFAATFDDISITATGDIPGPTVAIQNPFAADGADALIASDDSLVFVVSVSDASLPGVSGVDINSVQPDDLVVTVNGQPAAAMAFLDLLDEPLTGDDVDNGRQAPTVVDGQTLITFVAYPPAEGWDLGGVAMGTPASLQVTASMVAGSILNPAGGGNAATSSVFTANFIDVGGNVIQAINPGGIQGVSAGTTITVNGVDYVDDANNGSDNPTFANGVSITAPVNVDGNTFGNGASVDDILSDDAALKLLYGTERSSGTATGDLVFTISGDASGVPLTPGVSYAVELGFAEIFNDASQNTTANGPNDPQTRQFDVVVNGTNVLPDFNLFERAPGGHTIIERTVVVQPYANGEIVISLSAQNADQPKINAIKITELPGDPGGPITVGISVSDVLVNESEGSVNVVFTATEAIADGQITVPFVVADGTALEGIDFTAPSPQTVVFDNSTTAIATFQIANEGGIVEPDETFTISIDEVGITAPVGINPAAIPSQSSATVTIVDANISGPSVTIVNPFAADVDGDGNTGSVFVATDDNITITVELTDAAGVDLSSLDASDLVVTVNGQTVPAADMELLTLFDDPLLTVSGGGIETDDGQLAPVVAGNVTSVVFIAKAPAGGWDIGGAEIGTPTAINVTATVQPNSILNAIGGASAETTASFTTNFIDPGTDVVRAINAGGGVNGTSPGDTLVVKGVLYEDDDTIEGESGSPTGPNNQAEAPQGVTITSTLADGTVVSAGGDGAAFGGAEALADIAGEGSDAEAQIFATERFAGNPEAKLEYTITTDADGSPLNPNGTYAIELSFAEIFNDASNGAAGNQLPGDRVFDVLINDEVVINDLDLIARAPGSHVIVERTVLATVVDGAIKIAVDGAGLADNAKISAFKISLVDAGVVDAIPPNVTDIGITLPVDAQAPMTVEVAFDEPVSVIDAAAVTLNAPGLEGGTVPLLGTSSSIASDGLSATVSIEAPVQGFANGDYTATVAPGAVLDLTGNPSIAAASTAAAVSLSLVLDANEIYDENVNGDLSDDASTPTALTALVEGSNVVTLFASDSNGGEGLPIGSDRDYFTVVVPEGFELSAIVLSDYEATSVGSQPNLAFLAVGLEGETINVDPLSQLEPDNSNLLGGATIGEVDQGTDILDTLGAFGVGTGFSGPLPAGTYNFWLNQNAAVSRASLDFQITQSTAPVVGDVVLAVNAGGTALNQDVTVEGETENIDFAGDGDLSNVVVAGGQFTDASFGNGLQPAFENTVYQTEKGGGAFSVTITDLLPGTYAVDLLFAEIFFPNNAAAGNGIGQRVFDIAVQGELVLDDFDILNVAINEQNGGSNDFNEAVNIRIPSVVVDASGTLTISSPEALANAPKLSGFVLRDVNDGRAVVTVAGPADAVETGDAGFTVLDFTVEMDRAPDADVTVTVEIDVDGTITTQQVELGTALSTGLPVSVPNDDAFNGAENVTVSVVDVVSGSAAARISPITPSATAIVTEDEADQVSATILDPFAADSAGALVASDDNITIVVRVDDTDGVDVTSIQASDLLVTVNGVAVPAADMAFLNLTDDPLFELNSGDPEADNGQIAPFVKDGSTFITFVASAPAEGWDLGGAAVGQSVPLNVSATLQTGSILDTGGVASALATATFTANVIDVGTDVSRALNAGGTQGATPGDTIIVNGVTYEDDDINNGTVAADQRDGVLIQATDSAGALVTGGQDGTTSGGGNQIADILSDDPALQQIYGTERFAGGEGNTLTYTISQDADGNALNPNARYAIELGFAEIFSDAGINQPGISDFGDRIFDVSINGDTVFEDLDLFQRAPGAFTIIERTFLAETDENGNLVVQLVSNVDNAKISAIKIVELPAIALAIGDGAAVEDGDNGTTTVVLPITSVPPAADETIELTLSADGGATTTTATVTLDANGAGTVAIDVSGANDDIADGDTILSVTLVGTATSGFVVDAGQAVGTVTISEDDFAPVAVEDRAVVVVDNPVSVDVLANDTDADGTAGLGLTAIVSVLVEGQPTADVAAAIVDGRITVTPSNGFTGVVDVTYEITDAGGNTGTGVASVSVIQDAVTIEVEDFDNVLPINLAGPGEFFEENQGAGSGGQVARLGTGGAGTAILSLDATTGIAFGSNNITVTYFDESDGVSSFSLVVNGITIGTVTLDNDGGFGAAQAGNLRSVTFQSVTLQDGDQLSLVGQADGLEFVRLDKIAFAAVIDDGTPDNQAPIVVGTVDASGIEQGTDVAIDLKGSTPVFVDPDEDPLIFTLGAGAPDYLSIDPNTGTIINNRPLTNDDAVASLNNGPALVTVTANDGEASVSTTFQVSVANANDAPVLSVNQIEVLDLVTTDQAIAPIETAGLFQDVDVADFGDVLAYTASNLPPELEIDETTGQITGVVVSPGTFTVSVTATDTSGASVTSTFAVNVTGEPILGDPIRVQAEDFTLVSGFFVENQNAADPVGDGKVIRLGSQTTGEATLDLDTVTGFTPGNTTLTIGLFDENDGQSELDVLVNDVLVATVVLDLDAGGGAAQASSFRTVTLNNVDLPAGAELKLVGRSDGTGSASSFFNEFVRVDYIDLVPTGPQPGNFAPFPIPAFDTALEAAEGNATFNLAAAFGDPEEDALTFALVPAPGETTIPEFLAVDPMTGVVSMTDAQVDEDTVFTFAITAIDSGGSQQSVSQTFTLNVTNNPLPTVAAALVAATVAEGETISAVATLDAPHTADITVTLSLVPGATNPATVPDDVSFDANGLSSIDVTIPAGLTTGTALVAAIDDGPIELDETFNVAITAANVGSSIDGAADQVPIGGPGSDATITDADAAPVAGPDAATVFAGGQVLLDLLENDTDADDVILTVTEIVDPALSGVTVTDNGDGTITVATDGTVAPGDIVIGYTLEDPSGNMDAGVATVTVSDDALLAIADGPAVMEAGDEGDTIVSFPVSTLPAVASQTVAVTFTIDGGQTTQTADVSLTADGTGTLDVTLVDYNDDVAGPETVVQADLIDVTTIGLSVDTSAASATAVVTEDDFDPAATDDTLTIDSGATITFDPASNDTDADLDVGEALSVTAIDVTNTVGGTVTLVDGEVTVTDDPDSGEDIIFGYTVSDSAGNTADGTVTVSETPDPTAPDGDLDGDLMTNAEESTPTGDIDGDGEPNSTDAFFYDPNTTGSGATLSGGTPLADDEVIRLDFNADGTPFQNGFTGVLQGTTTALGYIKEGSLDGAGGVPEGFVSDGLLNVPATTGDTGGSNNPQNDYLFAVNRSGSFTLEAVMLNPFFDNDPQTDIANSFDQSGIVIGTDSTNFVKLVIKSGTGDPENSVAEFSIDGFNFDQPDLGIPEDGYEQALLQLQVVVGDTGVTIQPVIEFQNFDGTPANIPTYTGPISPVPAGLAAQILDANTPVGLGVTEVNGGGGSDFTVQYDYLQVTGVPEVIDPQDPQTAEEVFAGLTGIDIDGSYADGTAGAAILTIIDGEEGIETSNFGSNSFQLTNTGEKQIAAVVIDFRTAVFGDSVIDFDGTAGDTTAKPFGIVGDGAGNPQTGGTGVITETPNGSGAADFSQDAYLFAGDTPLPNTTGTGTTAVTGGFRGLVLTFDGSEGGFTNGETIGFSGDMDPNSIAGIAKAAVDTGSIGDPGSIWDVGGISGAELVGSTFTVLFDDGTTATGYLGSDTSQAGSIGEARQGQPEAIATLSVVTAAGQNAVESGETGTYGGEIPIITVEGTPGDEVRITLQKGFNPVANDEGGVAALVAARLQDQQADFPVNNVFDVQTFDTVIGADGTVVLPANAFDYNEIEAGGVAFDGSNVQPLALTVAVIGEPADNDPDVLDGDEALALGPISDPIFLTNPTETPVPDAPSNVPAGVFEGVGGGNNFRFKIQIEDPAGGENGGFDPGGQWQYIQEGSPQDTISGSSQGNGFYLFGSTNTGAIQGPQENETLKFRIFVPEDETGLYQFRFRVAREGNFPGDAQNDLWLNLIKEDTPGSEIENFLLPPLTANPNDDPEARQEPEPVEDGFIKVFGGPNNGSWGTTSSVDGVDESTPAENDGNFAAQVLLDEPGVYVIEVAGRSQGFFVDFLDLYKAGNTPSINASDSPFIVTGDTVPTVSDPIEDTTLAQGQSLNVLGTFDDLDGDMLTLSTGPLPAGVSFDPDTGTFTVAEDAALVSNVSVVVTATDDDNNQVSETFLLTVVEQGELNDVSFSMAAGASDDIETSGGSLNSGDLESNLGIVVRFTIPDGFSDVSVITSAILTGVNEDAGAAAPTFVISAKDRLAEPGGSDTAQLLSGTGDLVGASVSNTPSGPTATGTTFSLGDVADVLNALIASQGPLNAGDVVSLVVQPTGGRRDIQQGTLELQIEGQSGTGTGGPSNTPPTVDPSVIPATVDFEVGDAAITVDLTDVFSDADQPDATLGFTSAGAPSGVSITGSTLTIAPTGAGVSVITLTATDNQVASVTETFTLDVTADVGPGNSPPTVDTTVIPASLAFTVGDAAITVNLTDVFSDVDQPDATLDFDVSGAPAGVGISGTTLTVAPSGAGTSVITLAATDDEGASVTETFTLNASTDGGGIGDGPFIGVGDTEFEDLTLDNYVVANRADASGGALIQTFSEGSATGTFNGPEGTYTFDVVFFNESDGVATWTMLVNGVVVESWQGFGGVNPFGSAETQTISGITLSPGDQVVFEGIIGDADPSSTGAEELARLDSVTVTAETAGFANLSPALAAFSAPEGGSVDPMGDGGTQSEGILAKVTPSEPASTSPVEMERVSDGFVFDERLDEGDAALGFDPLIEEAVEAGPTNLSAEPSGIVTDADAFLFILDATEAEEAFFTP